MLYSFAAAQLGSGKIIKHPMLFFALLPVDVQRVLNIAVKTTAAN
jgi:hypothetical protein